MSELRYWGLAIALGPVLLRNLHTTKQIARAAAQRFANESGLEIDYWDERDTSGGPGIPAQSLETVIPERETGELQ